MERSLANFPHYADIIRNTQPSCRQIVLDDMSINIVKVAVDPVWHLPSLASKLQVEESELRDKVRNQYLMTSAPHKADYSRNLSSPL